MIAIIGILLLFWLIIILYIICSIDTKSSGFILQNRIGLYGKVFKMYKIKTMRDNLKQNKTASTENLKIITKLGKVLRRLKLDELPQLINVLIGNMSFVGPRPDVPGFADKLVGEDRIILSIRPGITGPASIYFKTEEELLSKQLSPEEYNRNIIWVKKAVLNKEYIKNYTFVKDIRYIFETIKIVYNEFKNLAFFPSHGR